MLTYKAHISCLVFIAIATVAFGCGSSDDTTTALTKADFKAQAEKICAQADKRQEVGLQKFLKENGVITGRKDQEKLALTAGIEPIEEEMEELAALGAPAGNEQTVNQIIKAMKVGIAEGRDEPVRLVGSGTDPFAKAGSLAKAYGLKECASLS